MASRSAKQSDRLSDSSFRSCSRKADARSSDEFVSAIVAHPGTGENVGVSCERRKSRAAARRRREQRRFSSASDDDGGQIQKRDARAARKLVYQTIGGA